MSNFKDFDLELIKVSGNSSPRAETTSIIEWTTEIFTLTVEGKCDSIDVPTGGTTRQCCNKNNNVEPKCI